MIKWCVLTMLSLLMSCSHQGINSYKHNKPALNIKRFFNGALKAHGVVKNRQGDVIRYFSADIKASWKGNTGTLDETFLFNDGEQQQRIWTLKENAEGTIIATANDVIGEHPMSIAGNALFMQYILRIDYKGKPLDLSVDDRMFLVTDTRIINESILSKWGFRVGSVQLVIEKQTSP